mgnify:CR=1 FL=1
MKTFILATCLLYIAPLIAQSPYLSIRSEGENYYAYPPSTEFDVFDQNEKLIYTEEDLSPNYQIELDGEFLLKVYIDWADGVDEIELQKATLSLNEPEPYQAEDDDASDRWFPNQPELVDKQFEQNSKGDYNAMLEFEGDIQFRYQDGKASISEKGEELRVDGKYIAKTSLGFLKLSYNPESKEYWYVFTKEKGIKRTVISH